MIKILLIGTIPTFWHIPINVFVDHFDRAGFTVDTILSIYLENFISFAIFNELVNTCWAKILLKPSIIHPAFLWIFFLSLPFILLVVIFQKFTLSSDEKADHVHDTPHFDRDFPKDQKSAFHLVYRKLSSLPRLKGVSSFANQFCYF